MRRALFKGKFLDLIDNDSWEYVDRPATAGIVSIVGVVEEHLLLVEQYRHSQESLVVSLPGGLVDRAPTGGNSRDGHRGGSQRAQRGDWI
jgi:hypothetical protein